MRWLDPDATQPPCRRRALRPKAGTLDRSGRIYSLFSNAMSGGEETMAQADPVISRAPPSAAPEMAQCLAEAFADDVALSWIWPDREDRLQRLPHFFKPFVSGTIANGIALRSAGNEAISLWRKPGRTTPGRLEIMRGLPSLAKAFRTGRERSQLMSETLKAHHPTGFEWGYLQFIGVHPSAQGTGLGGAALSAGLVMAKESGTPIYVEVTNPDKVSYYQHFGFEIMQEFDIPDAGPHVWGMITGQ